MVEVGLEGLRVLLIDDQDETREAWSVLLEQQGIEVLAAASGPAALDILMQLGPHRRPDILLCDIAMPDQDGYLTLSKIRAWEASQGIRLPMPAIAFTAFSQREDRVQTLLYGFQRHLAKPVKPDEMFSALAAMASLRAL